MRSSIERRDKYAAKVRGLVIPGQGDRYRNNIIPRMMLEQCVKCAGITPMLQFSYVAYLEELMKHNAAKRPEEAEGILRKWCGRGLDNALMISTAACVGVTVGECPKGCGDWFTQLECEAAGCYWWDDACHSTPEPSECEYACDANTVALWHCNEGVGNLTDDACAPKFPLGFKGAGEPAWTTTNHCPTHALHFDGNDDYMFHPTLGDAGMSNGTMEMWFRPDNEINNDLVHLTSLWLKGGATTEYFMLYWPQDSGKLTLLMRSNTLGNITLESTTNPFLADHWYHVAVTWGAAGAKLYICGVLEDSNATTRGLPAGTQWDFMVGGQAGGHVSFDGIIDEIRLSDVQRTTFNLDGGCPG